MPLPNESPHAAAGDRLPCWIPWRIDVRTRDGWQPIWMAAGAGAEAATRTRYAQLVAVLDGGAPILHVGAGWGGARLVTTGTVIARCRRTHWPARGELAATLRPPAVQVR